MSNVPIEIAGELLGLGIYAVLTAVFTAAGLVLEGLGLEHLTAGQTTLGLWLVYFGILGLTTGLYLFGYTELLPRLRQYRGADGGA